FVIALVLGSMDLINVSIPKVNDQLQPVLNSAVARLLRRTPVYKFAFSIVNWIRNLIYSIQSGAY
ncbi:MAG: hypothetical protein ACYC6L_05535, partial [Anaerolineae bacterium]